MANSDKQRQAFCLRKDLLNRAFARDLREYGGRDGESACRRGSVQVDRTIEYHHMERCFLHATEPLRERYPSKASVLLAFTPDLGGLLAANQESIMRVSGCTEEEANAVLELLKAELKSQ